ncbi:DMT family transporter [Microbaculum marinum]|uniref:DMT family transporter n=1 Tax=Microbaculum marinum TaxID=1764581 RepID=A0AAW9RCX5_9HYPH
MSTGMTNVAMLFVAALIYGGVFSANKLAAEAGWSPLTFVFAQSLIAGIVLVVAGLLRGLDLKPTRSHIVSYLVIGAFVVGLPITLLTHVAPHLPAAATTLVLALSPVFTLMFAILARIEAFRWRALAGVVFGLAGVAVLVSPGSELGSGDATGWFLLALLAPVFFALSNVAASVLRPPATASLTMAAGVLLGSAVVVLPIMAFAGAWALPSAPAAQAVVPVLLAGAINAAFFVLLFEIIRRAGPTFFAQFNYLAVLSGIGWGAILFAERPGTAFWIALGLMLVGIYLSTGRPAVKDATPAAGGKEPVA